MHKTVSIEKQSRPPQVLLQLGELYKRHCKFDDWVTQDMTNPGLTGREIKRVYARKCLKKNVASNLHCRWFSTAARPLPDAKCLKRGAYILISFNTWKTQYTIYENPHQESMGLPSASENEEWWAQWYTDIIRFQIPSTCTPQGKPEPQSWGEKNVAYKKIQARMNIGKRKRRRHENQKIKKIKKQNNNQDKNWVYRAPKEKIHKQ